MGEWCTALVMYEGKTLRRWKHHPLALPIFVSHCGGAALMNPCTKTTRIILPSNSQYDKLLVKYYDSSSEPALHNATCRYEISGPAP